MTSRTSLGVPGPLHDVLGERTRPADLAMVLAAGAAVTLAVIDRLSFVGLPWWRVAVAVALVVDIAAGSVANLTRGTNDFYAERPRNRWGFIAVHVHVLVLAWALAAPLAHALVAWACTIASAVVVNSRSDRAEQPILAGFLVIAGATVTLAWSASTPAALSLVYVLFLFKVVYSFAVDHYREDRTAPADGVVGLTLGDRSRFVTLMTAAFARDPLFVALFPSTEPRWESRRRAFVGYLFDMNRLLGGVPVGLVVDGRLVAAHLVEPPASGVRRWTGPVAALVRSVPLVLWLGPRRLGWLNGYLHQTRVAMPDAPHHYLVMIGVDPVDRGHGHGGVLLRRLRDEVESSGVSTGLGLDTENPENVALYEHLGFTLVAITPLERDVVAHSMFRPNGARARHAGR